MINDNLKALHYFQFSLINSDSGAEPVEVDFSGSYTGRRKRSDTLPVDSLVREVKLKAVKVNTHGKYGSLIHEAVDGATPSRTIFDEAIYG